MDIIKYIKPKNYIAERKNTRQLFLVVGALLTNLFTYSLFQEKFFKNKLEELNNNEKHEFKLYHDSLYYIIL